MKLSRQFGSFKTSYVLAIIISQLVSCLLIVAAGLIASKYLSEAVSGNLIAIGTYCFGVITLVSLVTGLILSRPLSKIKAKLMQLRSLNQIKATFNEYDVSTATGLIKQINQTLDDVVNSSKQEVDQTKKEELFYKNLLSQLSAGIVVLDSSGKITLANEAAQAIIGIRTEEEIKPELTSMLPLTIYGEAFLNDWLASVKLKNDDKIKKWRDVELENLAGDHRYLEVAAKHFGANQSGATYTVLLLIDRTEEQQTEDRKVDFIAIAAHELRAPITIISGYLQIFEDELKPSLTNEQKSFMSKMQVSVEQLSGFINNILSVSKIEQGDIDIEQQEVDVNDLIAQNQEVLRLRADTHNKKLSFKFGKDLPKAAADPNLLPTVVSNLVGNAIKYTKSNGAIQVITQKNEATNEIEVLVEDNGIGIASSIVGNLFTKFYRSHRSKNQFGGSGIGLFLCKSIIDAHNGKIWVNSSEGKGSTFAFSLPSWKEFKSSDDKKEESQVTRTGHGWIKNHSMYRR